MAKFFDFSHLRGDIFGGLTAGVVALPLALAFGEASGAGPIAGVYGAIIVGFFAALFGGTPSQISGPTGPMIVVFAGVFASLSGDVSLVFATVVLAGVIQIAFGVLGFGQYIRLVPYPVVSGFMSGIGCIIIALQLARLFGHEPAGSGTIPALMEVPNAVSDPNWEALGIGLLTLAIVFRWPAKWGRYLPAPRGTHRGDSCQSGLEHRASARGYSHGSSSIHHARLLKRYAADRFRGGNDPSRARRD